MKLDVRKYPALALWHHQLAKGLRTKTTFDPVWLAACAEMNAIEAERFQMSETAEGYLKQSKQILAEALAETRGAA